jgi:hypothetical protein
VAQKVYREGFNELWLGFKLASDAELMYSMIGFEWTTAAPTSPSGWTASINDMVLIAAGFLKDCLPSDWAIQGGFGLVGRWSGSGAVLPPAQYLSTNAPVVGTRGPGGSAVQNTAVLVHKTVPYGRTGRMFLPGVSEAAVSPNGALDGSELTLWQTAVHAAGLGLVTYMDDPTSNFLAMQSQFAAGDVYTTTKPVNDLVVDGVVATQRRRLRR